jgi:hypothetical protein
MARVSLFCACWMMNTIRNVTIVVSSRLSSCWMPHAPCLPKLGFGSDAAPLYAEIAANRRRAGRPISHFDAQIAAARVRVARVWPRAMSQISKPAASR